MIPGSISRLTESTIASAATITAKTDIVNVTGSTQVNTINPGLGANFPQMLILNPVSGALTLGTSGNIAVGVALVQNRPSVLVWSKSAQKWLIESGV
jgi:hypothetical protein